MLQAIPCTTTPTCTTTPHTEIEKEAIRLYSEEGLSIENVRAATGLTVRRVRALLKDVPRALNTSFSKSVARVYELAIRPQGIKDYERREILHQEYGCTWDEKKGCYQAKCTDDTIKRVKEKVRDRARDEGQSAIFVMDWVCDSLATESRVFLENAALNLMARIDECVDEFMERFAAHGMDDSDEADLAHRKQAFATHRHLLKLVSGLHPEPRPALIERTTAVTNALEGTSDLPAPAVPRQESARPTPEPSGSNAFLDYVEARGWC